jgi:hypothetical protein
MSEHEINRRRFLAQAGVGLGGLALAATGCGPNIKPPPATWNKPHYEGPEPAPGPFPANRPNVILVRFGGGVRRRETVEYPDQTYCPFVLKELGQKQGVVFNNVEIADKPGIVTSHGQGTLYVLTGEYREYADIERKPLADRFEPVNPTIPEYLRKRYPDVQEHQALIVNGEDRVSEEFYTASNNHLFGVNYKSTVLSLYGFKTYLMRKQLAENNLSDKARAETEKKLAELVKKDYRPPEIRDRINPKIEELWRRWRAYYGDTGFVNPRGDRLLTALTLQAMKELRPRFVMINYNDPDYVHWGPAHFYTRAISIIDEGVREIYNAAQADPFYRDNTVFVVVPDCGRDSNRAMAVPYQHHFGAKSSHEIFVVIGSPTPQKFNLRPNVKPIDRLQQQISVAATVGELMGFRADKADAESLLKVV